MIPFLLIYKQRGRKMQAETPEQSKIQKVSSMKLSNTEAQAKQMVHTESKTRLYLLLCRYWFG